MEACKQQVPDVRACFLPVPPSFNHACCVCAWQARQRLFKVLAQHSQQSQESLDAALAVLCENAAYLLPDTPEATLALYAQHYRFAGLGQQLIVLGTCVRCWLQH